MKAGCQMVLLRVRCKIFFCFSITFCSYNNKPLFNHDLFKSKYMLEGSCVRVTNYLPTLNY